jgi:hypothetical protein
MAEGKSIHELKVGDTAQISKTVITSGKAGGLIKP